MNGHVPIAEHIFSLEVNCDAPTPLGRRDGGLALMIPITGGTVSGPRFTGTVMPGADWALVRDDGVTIVDARYAIMAEDGTVIQVFNGARNTIDRTAAEMPLAITSPRFIAPEGNYGWLNEGVFVGTLKADRLASEGKVWVDIFKMA
jgi:Protein of unknown function (DUF3237)